MRFHPAADIFPLLAGDEYEALKRDIAENGQLEPITIVEPTPPKPGEHKCYRYDESKCDLEYGDGVWHCRACGHNPAPIEYEILDGRNRYRACSDLGIEPDVQFFDGDDPVGFVVSLNLHRRHLTESQRAMVAARVANLSKSDAARIGHGTTANLQSQTRADAAKLLNVSERSVNSAKRVQTHAAPELAEAVSAGRVSVSAAADVAELPQEQQREIVAKGEREILEAAKRIRGEKAEKRRQENDRQREEAMALPPPKGQYRTIVIDPPWPVQKYERDVRPNQTGELDYPTMTHDEIRAFDVAGMAADDGCHLFCWTTQKHLPETLGIIEGWGFQYCLTMVWHKPGGPQPFGLPQYNCEFAIYARKNAPQFLDTKQFFTCNSWPRREHSRKPGEFYELIERVAPAPRIDVFSREARSGFDQFGNDTERFNHG